VLCPVCGLGFAIGPTNLNVSIRGKDHAVCSSECARKLRSNPPKYGVSMQAPKGKGRR
jgi:YHS domain-containing protein